MLIAKWSRFFLGAILLLIVVGCASTPGRDEPLGGIVTSVFSADGKSIAVSTSEGEVAVFDAQPLWFRRLLTRDSDKKPTSRDLSAIYAVVFRPLPLAFSPDGRILVAAGVGGGIVGWDVASGAEMFRTPASGLFSEVVFLADGHSFVAAGEVLAMRRSSDGQLLTEFATPENAKPNSATVSPDGSLLVVGLANGEIALYDLSKRLLLSSFKAHLAPVSGVAFHPDGTMLASTAGGYDLRLWRRNAGGNFEKSTLPLAAASAAKDSIGNAQGAGLLLWLLGTLSGARIVGAPTMGAPPFLADAESQFNRAARTTPHHCGSRLSFSADGRYLASTANLLMCADCVGTLNPTFMLFVTELETGATATARDRGCAVAVSPDGRIVATGGGAGAPMLLDTTTGHPLPGPNH